VSNRASHWNQVGFRGECGPGMWIGCNRRVAM